MGLEACPTWGKEAHYFAVEIARGTPKDVLQVDAYYTVKEYIDTLYTFYPESTSEEVIDSYLGHNPHDPKEGVSWEQREHG